MRFFIKSYGCQMNSYDSVRMADCLTAAGYSPAETSEDADILIFNTCSIREKADEKLFSDLGKAKLQKLQTRESGKDCIIIVTGCVAQAKSSELLRRAPYVNAVIGPQNIHEIVEAVKTGNSKSTILTGQNAKNKFPNLATEFSRRGCSEFLTIQEGCDNFCTYCVVPYTRGREVSRDVSEITEEAEKLVAIGVKEITLLGQNVNSYGGLGPDGKNWSLARLLFRLAEIKGLKRLRYLTSNPKDVGKDIAEAHRDIDILMPFLHLPVQSGSDRILKKMNRKYTVSEYSDCIDMLRAYRPDMAFSSDFITGFPTETDADFEDTLKLAEKIKFSQAYSFKYSPRENTAAAKMDGQIPEEIKSERLQILQDLLNRHQTEFNLSSVGKRLSVLLVKEGKYENQLRGRSEASQAVSVCAKGIVVGDIVTVKITEAKSHSLFGLVE